MQHILAREAALKKRIKDLESGHAEKVSAFVDAIEDLEGADPELAHSEGDKLVSQLLRDLGHKDAANAYDAARQDWWYA